MENVVFTVILIVLFLMLALWLAAIIDVIINFKKIDNNLSIRYLLIALPFVGPIIYFYTKDKTNSKRQFSLSKKTAVEPNAKG